MSAVLNLLLSKRGEQLECVYMDDGRVLLSYILPWAEVVTNFYDQLKSLTSGYASFDYEPFVGARDATACVSADLKRRVTKQQMWL